MYRRHRRGENPVLTRCGRAGFNVTKDRGVVIVSVPQTLDIQVTAEPECFQSRPGSPFGLEDPRLFWTVRSRTKTQYRSFTG